MSDFSWDHVTRKASDAMVEVGRAAAVRHSIAPATSR